MCGRYASTRSSEELVRSFEIDTSGADEDLGPDYNVAPTKISPAVLARTPRDAADGAQPIRQLRNMRWGLSRTSNRLEPTVWRVAMDPQFDGTVGRLLSERARITGRPEAQIVREAVGLYLTDPGHLAADIEDAEAFAEYELRKERGEVTFVSADEVRGLLGLAD